MGRVTDEQIANAARVIQAGGLVAFPTETVYGLGADALNAQAVARIFALKGRPHHDPLIVHIADFSRVAELAAETPDLAVALAERFWPGPLTLVLAKTPIVPDLVTAGLPTVALRCPAHPTAQRLLRAAGCPLAAPSANRFGKISPTTAEHVRASFGDACPLLLDDGPCLYGVESTVVAVEINRIRLLRPGGVTVEQLTECAGEVERPAAAQNEPSSTPAGGPALSPGMLPEHYAPDTPLRVVAQEDLRKAARQCGSHARVGLLYLGPPPSLQVAASEPLSISGDLSEAASNLYAALRRLDQQNLDMILASWVPEQGIGLAINDRLRRASAADTRQYRE